MNRAGKIDAAVTASQIIGSAGNEKITVTQAFIGTVTYGGDGNDVMIGSIGANFMNGDAGNDTPGGMVDDNAAGPGSRRAASLLGRVIPSAWTMGSRH